MQNVQNKTGEIDRNHACDIAATHSGVRLIPQARSPWRPTWEAPFGARLAIHSYRSAIIGSTLVARRAGM